MMKKTVLITGASRGIGRAIALAFAQKKYNLVLCSSKSCAELEHTAQEVQSLGADCIRMLSDVSDYRSVQELFATAKARFGKVDILINNAGIAHIGLLQDMSYEEWEHIVNVNLSSVFATCKLAIPDMISQKSGSIINISSVWGVCGASCEVAYSATKGGINAFTKALAKELAPSGINVNAIACGVIDTEMNHCFSPEERIAIIDEIPAGRMGTPDEVASLVLAISEGSSYLTGQIIALDGGYI
ncbi:MAG: elongation factor P 5-aminopentanone reductase [Lachnospiraceae bacterium]